MNSKRKIAAAAAFLIALHVLIFGAGFFAPYRAAEQNRDLPYAAPTLPHFREANGKWHLRPFVYEASSSLGADSATVVDTSTARIIPVRFFVRGARYEIAGLIPARVHLFGTDGGGKVFLFGTDEYGRDLFSRVLYGGQISLLAGSLAAGLALGIGLFAGTIAGFYGGWADDGVMRVAELFLALPWLYLLFAVRAFLPLSLDASKAFLLIVCVIGFVGWARPARLIRGVALAARERGFVRAARGAGASNFYLLRRHVLPQTYGLLLTQAAILVPQYILAEVTLSFLGLGVSEPQPSWGNLLASLQHYDVVMSYHWMFLPAIFLIPFFLGYSALASGLRESLGEAYL
jgi:peptide/nickel transport system permease protein